MGRNDWKDGSSCGAFDRAVASDSRGPEFEPKYLLYLKTRESQREYYLNFGYNLGHQESLHSL